MRSKSRAFPGTVDSLLCYAALALLLGLLTGCGESERASQPQESWSPLFSQPLPATVNEAAPSLPNSLDAPQVSAAALSWNSAARTVVIQERVAPPRAARFYAALSAAQYDAFAVLPAAERQDLELVTSAVHLASDSIVTHFFPGASSSLSKPVRSRIDANKELRAQAAATAASTAILAVLRDDHSNRPCAAPQGKLPDSWTPDAGTVALLPCWGDVSPLLLSSSAIEEALPPAPPVVGSIEFRSALEQIRRISDTRSADQLAIAEFWASGPGTSTPPGQWNELAASLLINDGAEGPLTLRTMAVLNIAMHNAGIAAWRVKYRFLVPRPWQLDPSITTPIGRPNHPSYTSGHSTFSAAAAEVLSFYLPHHAQTVRGWASEAGFSRLLGGIHYRFDNDQGLDNGRRIAELTVSAVENGHRNL